jgi:S-formylglutathione hydrolase FrmB
MGGYGAMKLGLQYPRVFGTITAHSAAVGYMRWADDVKDIPETPVIVNGLDRLANDPYELVLNVPASKRPHIYFDCGRKDFLLKDNEAFHAHLDAHSIPHTYRRFAGAHEWSYWDAHIQDALKHHMSVMGLSK